MTYVPIHHTSQCIRQHCCHSCQLCRLLLCFSFDIQSAPESFFVFNTFFTWSELNVPCHEGFWKALGSPWQRTAQPCGEMSHSALSFLCQKQESLKTSRSSLLAQLQPKQLVCCAFSHSPCDSLKHNFPANISAYRGTISTNNSGYWTLLCTSSLHYKGTFLENMLYITRQREVLINMSPLNTSWVLSWLGVTNFVNEEFEPDYSWIAAVSAFSNSCHYTLLKNLALEVYLELCLEFEHSKSQYIKSEENYRIVNCLTAGNTTIKKTVLLW